MNILADASLPGLNQAFPKPFQITLYHHLDEVAKLIPGQDILLCRATLKVNQALLQHHSLRYVATATSGSDHLDRPWLCAQNIEIIDAKGCNARAVADYVVSTLAYLEQQKKIQGKQAGVIGLGKVGTQVSARLRAAGFQVLTYDPPKALRESFQSCLFEELYQADLLCIHAELHNERAYPSFNLIDQQVLERLKPGCVLINAARGGIVNEDALLNTQVSLSYCTDVYLNEPSVDKRILNKATLCTPHIAGHSLEAKYLAVAMVSQTLHQRLGLPLPQFAHPRLEHGIALAADKSWQENVLSLYNPQAETLQLKKAAHAQATFLQLRKQHQQRHDFQLYIQPQLSEQSQLLLGKNPTPLA